MPFGCPCRKDERFGGSVLAPPNSWKLPYAAIRHLLPTCCPAALESHNRIPKPYLGGQGDLVSRLLLGIDGVIIWLIVATNLLTKSS